MVEREPGVRYLYLGVGTWLGEGPEFQGPANMAVDASGRIVVADGRLQAIVGVLQTSWPYPYSSHGLSVLDIPYAQM